MHGRSKRHGERPSHADLAAVIPFRSEDEIPRLLGETTAPFLLVLEGIQDPHNLGACLRTADAAGVHAVIAPRHRAASITETVRRVACGAAEHMPFFQVTNVVRTLTLFQEAGLRVVGTAGGAPATIYDVDLTGPLALVMGSEGEGLRRLTAETCDLLVRVPMAGHVECLNVTVAAGVCVFEAVRQRRK